MDRLGFHVIVHLCHRLRPAHLLGDAYPVANGERFLAGRCCLLFKINVPVL